MAPQSLASATHSRERLPYEKGEDRGDSSFLAVEHHFLQKNFSFFFPLGFPRRQQSYGPSDRPVCASSHRAVTP